MLCTGPVSLIQVPIYLAKSKELCSNCNKDSDVFCLVSKDSRDIGLNSSFFTTLSFISYIERSVLSILEEHAKNYYYDHFDDDSEMHLANHCAECGHLFSDYDLHHVGDTFEPLTKEGALEVTLYELPIKSSIKVVSNFGKSDVDMMYYHSKIKPIEN